MADTLGADLPREDLLEDHFSTVLESFETSMEERLQAIEDRRGDAP